jgi:ATP-dependent RNA helicase RhlE
MLDMGFVPDVTRILNMLPQQRQSLLFSATFSEEIKRLADTMLCSPVLIEVARRNQVSENITHRVHPVSEYGKRGLLIKLLKSNEIRQCLVFMRTKQGCSRLTRELQRAGIQADAIHGDKSQLERIKALDAFKAGETHALIATDVAARGLDVDDLPYVINYELPHTPEDYVHRIGRTGRAGKLGNAISLVSAHEVGYLVDIEKLIKRPIEQVEVVGFEPEAEYEYPPGNKKKHAPKAAAQTRAPVAPRTQSTSSQRPQRRSNMIAADGFDFSKPYESSRPTSSAPKTAATNPHKPVRVVAALLGGLGKK